MRRALLGATLAVAACSGEKDETAMSRDKQLDPETCKECHEDHYNEWSASMHAYAADDPVFLAMNQRGQRETDGELGDFCVNCHAPMAVREGATEDGLNLDDVPQHLKGVTCYFCHNVEAVEGTHNNPLALANDTTMRGPIRDPVENPVHDSAYSPLLDANALESSDTCGSCHDIVVPAHFSGADEPVALERTFTEWKDGFFSKGPAPQGCAECHMTTVRDTPIANFEGVKTRERHKHLFPAVDVALTPFPPDNPAAQEAHEAAVRAEIDQRLFLAKLCVLQLDGIIRVELDNFIAGHSVPSGATQDRRVWLELRAYDENGQEIYTSGVLTDDLQAVVDLEREDEHLTLLRDKAFDVDGNEAHMFWDIAKIERGTIPGVKSIDVGDPETGREVEDFNYPYPAGFVDRATLTIRVRPMGLEVLRDLAEGEHQDLDPRFIEAMPIHDALPNREDVSVTVEWTYDQHAEDCVSSDDQL